MWCEKLGGSSVLIETYWNVNSVALISIAGCLPGINRNILECKWEFGRDGRLGVAVLIETYWNVNEDIRYLIDNDLIVLIETYWNVNY